jgi:ATP-dependent helicase/nuclease subunit A
MSEAGRIAADAPARERAISSEGSVLVQAPAGSGKTTLLAQRYLRLLASVDSPERILALTFTRRAAQEMRQRVLGALSAALLAECPQGMNQLTWSLAAAAKKRMDSLNCDLQSQPSRLRIETIDAFNSWLANQLPIAAGAGAGLSIQTDAAPSYQEAARRALAHQGGDQFGLAVDRVLELDDQRWRKLVKLIAEMLPSRDRWLPLLAGRLQAASAIDEVQLASVRRHLDEDLRLLVTRLLLRAHEVFGKKNTAALSSLMHGAAQRLEDPTRLAGWREDASPLRDIPEDAARWRSMATLLLRGDGRALRKRVTKTEGFPPGIADKTSMLSLIESFAADPRILDALIELRTLPDAHYSDAAWERVREVAQVLVLAAAELDGVFREQGAVDFSAVSIAGLRALGSEDAPTDLSLRLDYRLQHILVDEFQDTSSSQLQLVRLLTGGWQQGDGRSVFCVGDPMQSIYGFRQAEVRAFLELAEEGIGELRFEVQRLRSNFRSAPPLVDWTNRCFARLMPEIDDRNRGAIAYRPSEAAVSNAAECGVLCQAFASRSAESNAIAAMVAGALKEHPNWRIAVLVRARTHARGIAASLRALNIDFRAVDIEPLQDRAAVRDIMMLTRALLHRGDRIAWFAVLRAPWAGLCLADLLKISAADSLVWDAIRDDALLLGLSEDGRARCARLRLNLEAAFEIRNETGVARWIERTWLGLGGPSCMTSAQDLHLASAAFARIRDLEERGMPDPADLPEIFADLFADHGSASAVEIMTIHKAKGLEFDLVVLPALDRAVPPDRNQLLLSHQFARTGRDGMVMAARPPVGSEADLLFDFLRCQRRDAAVLEAQRLLYVACTRAKCQLRLTAVIEQGENADDLDDSAPRRVFRPPAASLLRALWPVLSSDFELPTPLLKEAEAADDAPRGGPLKRLPLEASFDREFAPLAGAAIVIPVARDETPIFDWAGETARRVGSLVHAELQKMDLASLDEAAIRARETHFRRWLKLHGVPEDRVNQATARVVEALLGVHRDPRGRWILAPRLSEDLREHALSGYWQGEFSRVVLDRSFIDEAGIRWVIDYKTSQHLGGGLEAFLDREVERYRSQLERYGRLARRLGPQSVRLGLYFPLMGAWREWILDEAVDG